MKRDNEEISEHEFKIWKNPTPFMKVLHMDGVTIFIKWFFKLL